MRQSVQKDALSMETTYFRSCPGILKLLQLLLCVICTGIMGFYVSNYADVGQYFYSYFRHELFFVIVCSCGVITSGCIVFSLLISAETATHLPNTAFEWMYHLVMAVLLFSSSVAVLTVVNERDSLQRLRDFEAKVTTAVLGMVNAGIYLLSFIISIRSRKKC